MDKGLVGLLASVPMLRVVNLLATVVAAFAAVLLALLLALLRCSWRVRVRGAVPSGGSLLACWHGDLIALLAAPLSPRPTVLVSRSRDGTVAAWAARLLGYRVVRGSTSSGAVAGARALVRALRAGETAAVAVDGPRGPRELASSAAERIAGLARARLLPIAARARPAIRFRSWDRMLLPLPFARVEVALGVPLEGEPCLQGALERLRARLLSALGMAFVCLVLQGCAPGGEELERALASRESSVRAAAIERLAESRDRRAVELVVPHLKDTSPRVRRAAVAAVASLGGARSQLGRLIDRLQDGDLEVRLATARALGDSGDPRARAPLVGALDDRSVVIRRAASAALSTLGLSPEAQGRARAGQRLAAEIGRLQHADDQVRASAAHELGLSEQAEAVTALVAVLERGSPLAAREAAIALGRIGTPRARETLTVRARAKHPVDRASAARGLALLGGEEPAGQLVGLLADPAPEVRRGVLIALAGPGSRSRSSPLGEAICRQLAVPELALVAARALRALGLRCPAELAALIQRDPDLERTLEVVVAAGDPASTPTLLEVARRRYRAHRAESIAWIAADRWREIDGEERGSDPAPDPTPPPKGDKTQGDPGKRPALERLLRRFPDAPGEERADPLLPPRVSAASVEELIRFLGERASSPVRAWLAEVALEAPPALRAAALRALVIGSPETPSPGPSSAPTSRPGEPTEPAARALWAGLKSDRTEVRRAAALGCRLLGPAAPSVAESLLRDRDFEIRQAGAACAGELRLTRTLPALLRFLREERSASVIRALGVLGERRAAAALAGLLREEQAGAEPATEERVLLLAALGELADPGAAPVIERELGHPDWRVRLAAARALVRAPRRASRAALEVCRADFVAEVRRACVAGLRGLR